jgi:uncharacterized protein YkwD
MPLAVAAVGLALACPVATGSSTAAANDAGTARQSIALAPIWETHMLARVNALRSSAGVGPLRMCARLTSAAREHAEAMATTGVFSHAGPAGDQYWDRLASVGYRMQTAGEVLAAGQLTPRDAMNAWQGSAPHYAVLTNPAFRHVGFAFAVASTGEYSTYWVQDFATGGRCT